MIFYTDGACSEENGGWSVFIVEKNLILYGKYENTTSNRMEMQAIINAIQYILKNKFTNSTIYTDSKYCEQGINNWMHKWKKNSWIRDNKQPVLNLDLWKNIYDLYFHSIKIKYEWISRKNNKIADKYAKMSSKSYHLGIYNEYILS